MRRRGAEADLIAGSGEEGHLHSQLVLLFQRLASSTNTGARMSGEGGMRGQRAVEGGAVAVLERERDRQKGKTGAGVGQKGGVSAGRAQKDYTTTTRLRAPFPLLEQRSQQPLN